MVINVFEISWIFIWQTVNNLTCSDRCLECICQSIRLYGHAILIDLQTELIGKLAPEPSEWICIVILCSSWWCHDVKNNCSPKYVYHCHGQNCQTTEALTQNAWALIQYIRYRSKRGFLLQFGLELCFRWLCSFFPGLDGQNWKRK